MAMNVMDLAAGGLGALVKHAPHFPGRDADSDHAEAAMPSPDPDVLAAEDGSPPDDLLYLLYRTSEPRDLGATVREWHDLAVTTARMAQDVRAAGLGGFGSLIEGLPSGTTATRTDARLRIGGPDRYRVDYPRRADRSGLQVNACDGERYWRVFPDRTLTGPAAPLGTQAAHLIYTGWLLRCRLSGARDITYRGRRARQLRVNRGGGTGSLAGPLTYFPADAIVDAETGCLLRLIAYIGDTPSAWWELDDISTEPIDPDDFRVHIPPGTRVVEETGNPITDYTEAIPGLAGTATRIAFETVHRTTGAVSAARSFLDDLRGCGCERAPPGPRAGHSPPLSAKKADHGDLTRRLPRQERYVAAVCRRTRLCWAKRRPTGELLMTAPHARQPQVLPRPACTPTAIRAVLAANADGDTLQRYDEDLDAAFEQAREQGDVTPLAQTVRRWWFQADAWRDPQAQREFLARINTYRDEGPPPAEQRMSREEIRTQFGV